MDPETSPSIMTAILFGVPLTRRAPLLLDAARLAESRAQHRRVFGRRRRRGHRSRRRTRRGRDNRRRPRRSRGNRAQRLIANNGAQASGAAPAPPAPVATPPPPPPAAPATPLRLPSPTPGSFTLVAGPRDGPAPYAFQQAGQSSAVTAPATVPAATPAGLAPATPPSVWARRVHRRLTTEPEEYSPGLRPGSWTATFQRLSNGVLPNRSNGEAGPSGEGGYSPN